jgi:nitrogen-specific signal transduction histidine kinase
MASRVDETHRQLEGKVAELQATREQFAHAQRMEAVGRLAGGVAHDFNNLLSVILGGVELVLSDPGPPDRELLVEIRAAGERAAGLTRQLLAFSRRQVVTPSVVDLNALVVELERMLGRLLGERFRLETRPLADVATVHADRGQIEQVVVNLVVNARDAMPEGGTIVVETRTVTVTGDHARSGEDAVPGEYVTIAVRDTGTGMTDEVRSHLFEPFFTTKSPGKGTGLGLATSYGIARQSGGHIAAYTEVGRGTTMRVYLPLAHAGPEPAEADAAPPRGGSETILLVEDEPGVRRVAAHVLGARGYRVLETASGEEALRVLEAHPDEIHLLLTDVVLPGLGGRELAERAAELRRDLKILFASGYTDDVVLQHRLVTDDVPFIQKPFAAASLSRKVREVLDAR